MAENGDKRAKRALKIANGYDKTIAVILIGNNIVNILAASMATAIATSMFGVKGVAITTAVMTVVILVFGEVLPKSLSKANSEHTALAMSGVLSIIIALLMPIAFLFVQLQKWAQKLSDIESGPLVTEQELLNIIETSEEEGVIDEQRSELMQSVLSFTETTVQEVLTPRVDLAAIDLQDSHEEILELILTERFSRMPVYENTLDNIVGILHTRDYLEAALAKELPADLRSLCAKPLFVHKTQKIASLLNELKRSHTHIAVVLDDYGGTMGIVSLEDLLEELVGDIYDEDEEIEQDFFPLEPGVYSVSGDLNVYETLEMIGYDIRDFDSEYPSMGGWALEMFERVPAVGDSFTHDGITVTVSEMEEQRILRLTVAYPTGEQND